MIGFNGDWDEPDVWSTPTPSPLAAEHTVNPTSTGNVFSVLTNEPSQEPHASSSSPVHAQLDFSNGSFQPINAHNIADSNSDQESSTPQVLQSPLQFNPTLQSPGRSPEHFSDPELPPTSDSQFPSLSLVTGSWPTEEALANDELFDPSSTSGFDEFDSPQGFKNEEGHEDDEFGDFDDGEMTVSDENFGRFTASSPLPPSLPTMPVVPFKLPDKFTEGALRSAMEPALNALLADCQSDASQAWLEPPIPPVPHKTSEQRSTTESRQMPSILKSDDLQRAWRTLVDGGNGLGRPVEWKRSQIRRFHLVHLGIPVDLNDFLEPPPLASKLLTIQTKPLLGPHSNGQTNCHSPATQSPYYGPILDQKRCEELVGMSEVSLATQSLEQLTYIRDELELLGQRASEMLTYKQQKRDRSIQDCKAYNTMISVRAEAAIQSNYAGAPISDLVLAAQKIQMASPGSTKRASSINLGSSSISGSSSKWPSLTRSNSHQNKGPGKPQIASPPPIDLAATKSN
ncbi:hypothetical protein VP01_2513g2 [Puccinia sorghi]|uniref:Uncharacterized protein n=1 Tax=Puccinia sorghi TaxID=27349 RepID=A0A0L6V5N9_9BASI|nr:hypothetical protein VP01_2513g2 [Puccinia sorghi]